MLAVIEYAFHVMIAMNLISASGIPELISTFLT